MARDGSAVVMRIANLFGPAAVSSIAVVLALATPTDAKADWYDAVKGIISDLIEQDIATNVIPNAATKLPFLCEYMPASIAAIQEQRFSGIQNVVRRELADAIGYETARAIDPSLPALTSVVWVPAAEPKKVEEQKVTISPLVPEVQGPTLGDAVKADKAPFACRSYDSAHKTWTPNFAGKESTATTKLRDCITRQDDMNRDAACAAGLLVRDAVVSDGGSAEQDIRRLAVDLAVGALATKVDEVHKRQAADILLSVVSGDADLAKDDVKLRELTSALGLAKDDQALVLETFSALKRVPITQPNIEVAIALTIALDKNCDKSRICGKLKSLVSRAESAKITAIFGDIMTKNYGAAVGDALESMNGILDCPNNPKRTGCGDTDQAALKFVRLFAVYLVDSATSSQNAASAEADLRKAAVELLRLASGAGVLRSYWSDWPNAKNWFIPDLSLRYAWRPGHLSSDGGFAQIYPSVDWIKFRLFPPVYTHGVYGALHVSLVDLLGPFSEGATRTAALSSDAADNKGKAFLLQFLGPRLDLQLAAPELSRNLSIGAGAAFRFVRASPSGDATPVPTYCLAIGTNQSGSDCRDGRVNWNNMELSLFAKYVF